MVGFAYFLNLVLLSLSSGAKTSYCQSDIVKKFKYMDTKKECKKFWIE